MCPPEAKAFMLVTDNRRSRLDCLFYVITQHRKFELGHHRQNKKISNAQELTMQLSQTQLSHGIRKRGNGKRKKRAVKRSNTSLKDLSKVLEDHGRHSMLFKVPYLFQYYVF